MSYQAEKDRSSCRFQVMKWPTSLHWNHGMKGWGEMLSFKYGKTQAI